MALSVGDVAKTLRMNVRGLDDKLYAEPNVEMVVEHYEGLLKDFFDLGGKVTGVLLAKAAKEAFSCEPGVARMFAERISSAMSHCKVKLKQATSGRKLPAAVKRVVMHLRKKNPMLPVGRSRLSSSLKKMARELVVHHSISSNEAPPDPKSLTLRKATGRETILAAYGASSSASQQIPHISGAGAVEISSEEEEEGPPAEAISKASSCSGFVRQYMDSGLRCMVR